MKTRGPRKALAEYSASVAPILSVSSEARHAHNEVVKIAGNYLLVWVLALSIGAPLRAAWPLDDEEYRETRHLASELLGDYPSADNALVFPGRSGGTIARFMNLVGEGLAYEFPISGFRHQVTDTAGNREMREVSPRDRDLYRPLSETEELKLFKHFDLVLPTDTMLAGRAMVLVDYGMGDSLHALRTYVRRYLRARGRDVRLKTVLLFDPSRAREKETEAEIAASRFDHVVSMKKYPLLRTSMYHHDPELYTPIGEWKLASDKPGFTHNRNDFNLRSMEKAMGDRFAGDETIPALREKLTLCRFERLANESVGRMPIAVRKSAPAKFR